MDAPSEKCKVCGEIYGSNRVCWQCCNRPGRQWASQQSEVGSSEWMDALRKTKTAIEALLNRGESMNAHELSLALHEAVTFIEDEMQQSEGASIGVFSDGGREAKPKE